MAELTPWKKCIQALGKEQSVIIFPFLGFKRGKTHLRKMANLTTKMASKFLCLPVPSCASSFFLLLWPWLPRLWLPYLWNLWEQHLDHEAHLHLLNHSHLHSTVCCCWSWWPVPLLTVCPVVPLEALCTPFHTPPWTIPHLHHHPVDQPFLKPLTCVPLLPTHIQPLNSYCGCSTLPPPPPPIQAYYLIRPPSIPSSMSVQLNILYLEKKKADGFHKQAEPKIPVQKQSITIVSLCCSRCVWSSPTTTTIIKKILSTKNSTQIDNATRMVQAINKIVLI